jgi:hypothetical protein
VNPTAKTWLIRLMGVPITILVLSLGAGVFLDGWKWLTGDGYPILASIPALVVILWATFRVAGWTVFASQADLLSHGIRRICCTIGIVSCLILVLWAMHLPEQPYDRETLKFGEIKPATVNVTGAWTGSWTDPRSRYSEVIKLTLEQTGNVVTGTIHSERDSVAGLKRERELDIIEGHVSGDRINLYYKLRFVFRADATATLLGMCKQDEMSGEYVGHVAARPGGTSKGNWQVSRSKP